MAGAATQAAPNYYASTRAERPTVNSFDIFDTLIARRCIDPAHIFDVVEARSGFPGFAAAREEAERAVMSRLYTLEMIYEGLSKRLVLGKAQAQTLQALEIAVELENAIPIAENIAAVADGDLLIADTYLSEETIRSLLQKVGFDKHVAVIVGSDGKRSGRVWPEVRQIVDVAEHRGDDPRTDVASARQGGVRSRRTEIAKPNRVEEVLIEIGLTDLAALARETRLRHWSADPDVRVLQLAEASYNFPILAIASVLLLRYAERWSARTILFSSRECNLWLPICRKIAEAARVSIEMRYFYTSRLTRLEPSEDYLAYARGAINERTVVVDLCGASDSLSHLLAKIGRRDQPVAFLHRLDDNETLARASGAPHVQELFADVRGCDDTAIEMCNYASHGMVLDVRQALGCLAPVFAPDNSSARVKAAIAVQQALAADFVRSLGAYDLKPTLNAPDEALATVGGALYKGLARSHFVHEAD